MPDLRPSICKRIYTRPRLFRAARHRRMGMRPGSRGAVAWLSRMALVTGVLLFASGVHALACAEAAASLHSAAGPVASAVIVHAVGRVRAAARVQDDLTGSRAGGAHPARAVSLPDLRPAAASRTAAARLAVRTRRALSYDATAPPARS